MRTVTPATQAKLDEQFGTEPVTIVEVQWAIGGPISRYADKAIAGHPAQILNISGIDSIINITEGSDVSEMSITLSDLSGSLRDTFNYSDIHKRDVWVYLWFEGTDLSDKMLLFRGQINTPIEWTEGDRTLRFDVVSRITDAEVGFSIEEGQFQDMDHELIGVPWPLKFGTTRNVPALRITGELKENCTSPHGGTIQGNLVTGFGFPDYTLPCHIQEARRLTCPDVFSGYRQFGYNLITGGPNMVPEFKTDHQCILRRCTLIKQLQLNMTEQAAFVPNQIVVDGGHKFPQGVLIDLEIQGGKLRGTFDDNVFTITSMTHPKVEDVPTTCEELVAKATQEYKDRLNSVVANNCPGQEAVAEEQIIGFVLISQKNAGAAAARQWAIFQLLEKAGFVWAAPGTKVSYTFPDPLEEFHDVSYITNIVPEEILQVKAWRGEGACRGLSIVPQSYYTTTIRNYGSYQVTEIYFDQTLSSRDNGWDDEIFITSVSSVGPNTVDILRWLIETYTDFGIDTASFDEVHTRLENYPMDFPLLERKNIVAVLRELAFQARCVIFLRDNVFYLRYLSETPSPVDTFTASDIDFNTLVMSMTRTEDLVTKLVAVYQDNHAQTDPNKIIIRHNVAKYGIQEETYDFYGYKHMPYVYKSATFWAIRKSNTWRRLSFTTPIHKIPLEVFDYITIDLPTLLPEPVVGMIISSNTDLDNQTVAFEVELPIKAGSVLEYEYYHPADIPAGTAWPTDEEYLDDFAGSGDAPGFSTVAPPGSPLNKNSPPAQGVAATLGPCASQGKTVHSFTRGPNGGPDCGDDQGDESPSDQDDQKIEELNEGDIQYDSGDVQVDRGPTEAGPGEGGGGATLGEDVGPPGGIEKALSNELINDLVNEIANQSNRSEAGQTDGPEHPAHDPVDPDPGWEKLPTAEELRENQEGPVCLFFVNVSIKIVTSDSPVIGPGATTRTDIYGFTSRTAQVQFTLAMTKLIQEITSEGTSEGDEVPFAVSRATPLYNPPCPEPCDPIGSPATLNQVFPGGPQPAVAEILYQAQVGPHIEPIAC